MLKCAGWHYVENFSIEDWFGISANNSLIEESISLGSTFTVADYISFLVWMDLQGLERLLNNMHSIIGSLLEKTIKIKSST